MSKLKAQIDELIARHDRLKFEAKQDGRITEDEQLRLDAVEDQIRRIWAEWVDRAQKELAKAVTDVVAKLKTDPSQVKSFQDDVKALPPDAQIAATEVLGVLYRGPRPVDPADERKQIAKVMANLSPADGMAVGKALNKIGVYIPNLKEDSPGAEDATARIKKIHMAAYYPGSIQADYVRDLIAQAKKQGFKILLQVKGSSDPDPAKKKAENIKIADDIKKQIVADMTGTIADVKELEKFVEILTADEDDWVWAEDNKWLSVDGTTIRTSPDISDATQSKFQSFTGDLGLKPGDPGFAREGHHTAGQTSADPVTADRPDGLVPDRAYQGAVDTWEYGVPGSADPDEQPHLSPAALAKATGKTVETNQTYNEGGNMLTGTLPNGQPYGVIGRDGVLISVFHMQEQYDKEPDPAKKKAHKFDPANVKARMATMTFDKDEIDDTVKRLAAAGMPVGSTAADKEKAAKEFLAKVDLVKDAFSEDTKIPREQLIFIAQPDFHIDMHMRPLAPGQIMINDFKANIALIDEALKKAAPGSWEEKQLKSMRDHTSKMEKVLGPVMDEIERQSKAGGLEVVRAPGVIEGEFDALKVEATSSLGIRLGLAADREFSRTDLRDAIFATYPAPGPPSAEKDKINRFLNEEFTRHVNFMNAIPGTKDGSNEQFYMTNYTSLKPLREAYESYLKSKGIEEVHWIGDDGGGRMDRSSAEQSLTLSGGLDCRENH